MKKIIRFFGGVILFLAFSATANAQFSLGAQAGLSSSGYWGKQLTFGARGEYNIRDNMNIVGMVNYHFPVKFQEEVYLLDNNGQSGPSATLEYKIKGISVNVEAKRYTFGTEYEDDLSFYFLFGAGLSIYPYGSEITSAYDEKNFHPNPNDVISGSLSGFTINLGFGTEIMVGDNFLFADAKLLLPANTANGQAIEVEIPAAVGLTVGYRFGL